MHDLCARESYSKKEKAVGMCVCIVIRIIAQCQELRHLYHVQIVLEM